MPRRVYIAGEGCNRRLLEISKIRKYLDANDYEIVCAPEQADYIILTTCAFKKREEDISVSAIQHYKKYNAELLLFGCLPDIAPSRFEAFKGSRSLAPKDLDRIDTFFDDIKIKYSEIPDAHHIVAYRNAGLAQRLFVKIVSGELFSREFFLRARPSLKKKFINLLDKTSRDYYLLVCRGCLGRCSYCAIRRSVGTVVSEPLEKILENFRQGYLEGYRNFIILGDDPGCYGIDINTNLPKLLDVLSEEYQKLRAEQSSRNGKPPEIGLHINEIHPKFLLKYQKDIMEIHKTGIIKAILCPIQSGNDRVLQLMQREHGAEELGACLKKIREINPHILLSTQVIVGFPAETEEDFQSTLDLITEIGFNMVVLFPYHKKEHTPASRLDGDLSERVIQQRLKRGVKYLRREGIDVFTKCFV